MLLIAVSFGKGYFIDLQFLWLKRAYGLRTKRQFTLHFIVEEMLSFSYSTCML